MEISTTTRAFAFSKARESADPQQTKAENPKALESEERDRKDAARRPWRNEPGFEKVGNWEQYLSIKEGFAILELAALRRTYYEFKSDLATLHPDFAGKDFSFALDAEGIKILDPKGTLSHGEKNRLFQSLSQYRGFGENLLLSTKLWNFWQCMIATGVRLSKLKTPHLSDSFRILARSWTLTLHSLPGSET